MTQDTYLDVLDELRDLTLKKRRGYSPGADPYKNFRMSQTFGVDPVKGIMIRVMDKVARIASLLENPSNEQVGESLRDSMMDAGNYLLIAVAFMDSEQKAGMERRIDQIISEMRAESGSSYDDMDKGLFDSSDGLPEDADHVTRSRFGPDAEDVDFAWCCAAACPQCGPGDECASDCDGHIEQ